MASTLLKLQAFRLDPVDQKQWWIDDTVVRDKRLSSPRWRRHRRRPSSTCGRCWRSRVSRLTACAPSATTSAPRRLPSSHSTDSSTAGTLSTWNRSADRGGGGILVFYPAEPLYELAILFPSPIWIPLWMRSSRVVRASDSQWRSRSQLSWVRSQPPPTQWNLRGGGIWSSVEYRT